MFTQKFVKEYIKTQYNLNFEKMNMSEKDCQILQIRRQIHKIHEELQSALASGNLYLIGNRAACSILIIIKIFAFFYMDPMPYFKQAMGHENKKNSTVSAEALKARK